MLRDAPFYINEEDLGPIKSCHISVNKILGQMDDIENRLRNERDQL